MKSGYLVSRDPRLFERVVEFFAQEGAHATDDVVQWHEEEGALITFFRSYGQEHDWEWQQEPAEVRGTGTPPPMAEATACVLECRSEHAVALLLRRLARVLAEPAWLLDGDGVLWPADAGP